jgi:hypothetical protein
MDSTIDRLTRLEDRLNHWMQNPSGVAQWPWDGIERATLEIFTVIYGRVFGDLPDGEQNRKNAAAAHGMPAVGMLKGKEEGKPALPCDEILAC